MNIKYLTKTSLHQVMYSGRWKTYAIHDGYLLNHNLPNIYRRVIYLYGLYWGLVVIRIDIHHICCMFYLARTTVCLKLMRQCGTLNGIKP
jgi:hypothetical protein